MTSIRIRTRPYTSPLIKNPTYPTVIGNQIREMAWPTDRTTMNPIDYKELLKKYIAHIIGEESTDFMGRSLDNNEHLTNEEVVELRRLSKEVDS